MHEFKRQFPPPPPDWSRLRLDEVADRITTRNVERNQNVLTISAERGLISQTEYFSRRVASESVTGYFVLERGDFAYNKSYSRGYPLGAIRRLDRYQKGCVSPLYICFRPRADDVDSDFLLHYLDGGAIDAGLANIAKEGVRNHGLLNVGIADFFALKVPLPPIAEQRAIAQVLDAIDTTIRETEAIIEKLKLVKQGLLRDLLTRGIDDNGELRPTRSQAPNRYKDSPLGWIPREWLAPSLGAVIGHLIDYRGRTPKKLGMEWGGGDILALSANNVQMGRIDTSREAYMGGDRLYKRWMTNGDPARGDVLMTLEAPLGNVAQIPDERRYILSQRVILIRFDAHVVNNDFAFWQLISDPFQRALVKLSTGTTATGIQRAKLVLIPFAVPPVQEQQAINVRLRAIESRLVSEESTVRKLRLERLGLTDDLLTGRVRVTPLLRTEPV